MKTFFEERKAFLLRMVKNVPNGAWRREMSFTKKIFERYPDDFLKVVKRPFNLNSLAYFIGKEGTKYLDLQLKLFRFKVKEEVIEVHDIKEGEDFKIQTNKTIRQFLNEEKK